MMRSKYIVLLLLLLLGANQIVGSSAGVVSDGIRFQHVINGMVIETSYTTKYGASSWKITDNKSIDIKLEVKSQPTDVTLYVENMHADVTIHAYREQVDGILQDTMDDRLHTGTYPGFNVDQLHPYTEVFSVEGYSEWLIKGWSFYCGTFGYGSVYSTRLTEESLIRNKVVGSQVTIIYDILQESNGKIYKTSIIDDFYIFINSEYNLSGFAPESLVEETKIVESEVPSYPLEAITIGLVGAVAAIYILTHRRH